MKTILLPTDFSKASHNAIDYAVEIAKLTKAKMILFHVYHIPVITSDVPIVIPSMDEIKENSLKSLKQVEEHIYKKHGNNFTIECMTACGITIDEINACAKQNAIDLIVMGMRGSGYLIEKIMGSVTTSLIKEAFCPVLSIDTHVKFKTIKKIVFACDYKETSFKSILDPLKEFAKLFKSHVYVLNVIPELTPSLTVTEAVEGIKLEHLLEGVEHSFDFSHNEDAVEGINDFVAKQKVDMVVMIPRQHSIFESIFKKSNTKSMAFHTHVPLLALH